MLYGGGPALSRLQIYQGSGKHVPEATIHVQPWTYLLYPIRRQ